MYVVALSVALEQYYLQEALYMYCVLHMSIIVLFREYESVLLSNVLVYAKCLFVLI